MILSLLVITQSRLFPSTAECNILVFLFYFSGTTHAISDALEQYELRESSDTVPGLPNVASRGLKRSDSNRIGNRRVS